MLQINESNCGREHVIPSIVQFCFVLLESLDVKDTKECDSSIELMGTEKLGICLLKTLFEVHDMARNEVCFIAGSFCLHGCTNCELKMYF